MAVSLKFHELLRHFLMRFYDNDLLSPDRDQLPSLASMLGLVAAPGTLIPFLISIKYSGADKFPLYMRHQWSVDDKLFFLTFSLTAIGMLSLIQWDALFPDRRDFLVLSPLPVPLGTIFGAKLASLCMFLGLFLAAVIGVTPLLFPAVVLGASSFFDYACFVATHLLVTITACVFTFLLILAVQGLALNVLPFRMFQRFSPRLQMVCMVGLVVQAIAAFEALAKLDYRHAVNPWQVYWSPPLWFLGLYQYMLGWDKPVYRDLAHLAVAATAAAAILAAISYSLAYRRQLKRCLEAGENQAARPGWLMRAAMAALQAVAAHTPAERAVFQFITATLRRSRKHQFYTSAYLALALAIVFEMLTGVLTAHDHSWLFQPNRLFTWIPLIILSAMMTGLRHTFEIPSELQANWAFQIAEPEDRGIVLRGIRRTLLVLGAVPVCLGLLPVYVWLWGPANALVHAIIDLSIALALSEVLMAGFCKIPFTCSYDPGQSNVKTLWALYVVGISFVILALGQMELWVLASPWRVVVPIAVAIAFGLAGDWWRWHEERPSQPFVFDDPPEPAVRELGLNV